MKRIILIAMVVLLSAPTLLAQDFCPPDFNYDGNVDANDVTVFLSHFGRSQFNNPCPPDGPTPVPKTGQTTSYATGDDGDLERGVALVTPRFTDNGDGTVIDNQTGLIWIKDANCFGERTWHEALSDSNGLSSGECGLTDGSNVGDWRLPNRFELESLLDLNNWMPAIVLPSPFQLVQWYPYWTSTTRAGTDYAWCINLDTGGIDATPRSHYWYLWPVRGGH